MHHVRAVRRKAGIDDSYFGETGLGLDPAPGPQITFMKSGCRWMAGNRPTRLAVEVAENDNGGLDVIERDPVTGEIVSEDANSP